MSVADIPMAHASHSGAGPVALFDYEIIERLGTGAHSVIYAAAHPDSQQICALKHVMVRGDREMRFYEQLENELATGQFVNHRSVRQSLELRQHYNRPGAQLSEAVLVMEFFDGVALDQWDASVGPLLSIFIKSAESLGRMHAIGLVHCDIKPSNILANESGEIRIIDLGQSCRIGTCKKRLQGTPDYLAPEQARLEPLSPRTDIYNFGATMYRMLTGKTLPTVMAPDGRIVEPPEPAPPDARNPQVPAVLSKLVVQCVRTVPDQRPRSMAEVIDRLEESRHALRH